MPNGACPSPVAMPSRGCGSRRSGTRRTGRTLPPRPRCKAWWGAATPLGLGGCEDRGQRQRGGDAGEHRGVTPAMVAEKLCVPFLRPPRRRLAPSTSSTLLMIEAFTTAVRPAERAKIVMMSSAALPKVALRTPPTQGPAWWLNDSVACPRTQASRTKASEVRAKTRSTERGAVRRRPRPSRRR